MLSWRVTRSLIVGALLALPFASTATGHDLDAGDSREMSGMDMHGDSTANPGAMGGKMGDGMTMSPHMAMTELQPPKPGDQGRAQKIVDTLKASIAKYKDYRVAERAGFKPFLRQLKLKEYHFTNYWNGFKAAFEFDPAQPTSLLYRPTPDGGYELIGAMYTAPKGTSEDKLDARVPLSVARWHRHINLCFPPKGTDAKADWTKFGFAGSITAKEACDAADGRFYPQVFGWMAHVYPWRTPPASVWAH